MSSCECCRSVAVIRCPPGQDLTEVYNAVMAEHERNGCVCTKDTPEGAIARAGQFWVDGKDTRCGL